MKLLLLEAGDEIIQSKKALGRPCTVFIFRLMRDLMKSVLFNQLA